MREERTRWSIAGRRPPPPLPMGWPENHHHHLATLRCSNVPISGRVPSTTIPIERRERPPGESYSCRTAPRMFLDLKRFRWVGTTGSVRIGVDLWATMFVKHYIQARCLLKVNVQSGPRARGANAVVHRRRSTAAALVHGPAGEPPPSPGQHRALKRSVYRTCTSAALVGCVA